MMHCNNRVVQYQLRSENCTNYPRNGKCYEFNYMSNHIDGNQGESFYSSLYGSYSSASNSWPQHSNYTAVEESYPALAYSNYGLSPLYPAGAPQHAVTSSLPITGLGGSPCVGASTSYAPSEYLPLLRAPEEQLYPPEGNTRPSVLCQIMEEGDDSECYQKDTPTEDSPEGPIQRECPFLASYGVCQSKSSCMFHHPEGRVPTCVFNSVGLPLRPGQRVCPAYRLWGLCISGRSCKYDHPWNGESSPYGSSSSQMP
ncbi:hypothetical protein AQUCO_05600086v1 [Aquilegia coerulea]|uniref:C3H1-type domain-containing protein n=1 Tax=Aquilegia coerulea TaxID=218851 RepID=A0A2G5CGN0_AQUCA|nr:hypothetical protein AQUCO_05600086v1 [Aquilegia coerulea]